MTDIKMAPATIDISGSSNERLPHPSYVLVGAQCAHACIHGMMEIYFVLGPQCPSDSNMEATLILRMLEHRGWEQTHVHAGFDFR